jgi:hypothetical protein
VNNRTETGPVGFNVLAFEKPNLQRTKSPDLLRKGKMVAKGGGGGIITNYHTYSAANQCNQQSPSLLLNHQPVFKSLKDARLERKLSKQRTTATATPVANEVNTFINFRTVRDLVKMQKQEIVKNGHHNLTPRESMISRVMEQIDEDFLPRVEEIEDVEDIYSDDTQEILTGYSHSVVL